jgi:hypothetical protein
LPDCPGRRFPPSASLAHQRPNLAGPSAKVCRPQPRQAARGIKRHLIPVPFRQGSEVGRILPQRTPKLGPGTSGRLRGISEKAHQ